MNLGDILDQYAARPTSTEADFDEVAAQAPPELLGDGIAQAFRSDQTPAFGDMVGQMFGGSNPSQRSGLLNVLIGALGPAVLGKLGGMLGGAGGAGGTISGGGGGGGGGGILGSILGGLTGSGGGSAAPQISQADAERMSPTQVRDIAEEAEKSDPGILDRVGGFYAQHPDLVKMLGGAALAIALGRMANRNPR